MKEWVIVDDGSNDLTSELVSGWIKEGKIIIKYIFQKNQGKHIAINKGLEYCEGLFTISVDSDDFLAPNSLTGLNCAWEKIPIDERVNYVGVTGLNVNMANKLIGNKFPSDVYDSNALKIYYCDKIYGDKSGMWVTSIRKRFKYPTIKASFYPEMHIISQIAQKYKTRYINTIIKIVDYQSTGLSSFNSNSALPKVLSHELVLKEHLRYFFCSPNKIFVSAILYNRWSFHLRLSFFDRLSRFSTNTSKLFVLFGFLPGMFLYLIDKYRMVSDGQ